MNCIVNQSVLLKRDKPYCCLVPKSKLRKFIENQNCIDDCSCNIPSMLLPDSTDITWFRIDPTNQIVAINEYLSKSDNNKSKLIDSNLYHPSSDDKNDSNVNLDGKSLDEQISELKEKAMQSFNIPNSPTNNASITNNNIHSINITNGDTSNRNSQANTTKISSHHSQSNKPPILLNDIRNQSNLRKDIYSDSATKSPVIINDNIVSCRPQDSNRLNNNDVHQNSKNSSMNPINNILRNCKNNVMNTISPSINSPTLLDLDFYTNFNYNKYQFKFSPDPKDEPYTAAKEKSYRIKINQAKDEKSILSRKYEEYKKNMNHIDGEMRKIEVEINRLLQDKTNLEFALERLHN